MLTSLVQALEQAKRTQGDGQQGGSGKQGQGSDDKDAGAKLFEKKMMMAEVIRLGDEGSHEDILNLGGGNIDAKVRVFTKTFLP